MISIVTEGSVLLSSHTDFLDNELMVALRAEKDHYAALAFSWADLLFEIDPAATILFAAGATDAFFGRDPAQLLGAAFTSLVAPADIPALGPWLKQMRKMGRNHPLVLRIVYRNGDLIWMALSGYCLEPQGPAFLALRLGSFDLAAAQISHPRDLETGLLDGSGFAEMAAGRLKKIQEAGQSAEITLISMPDLAGLQSRMDADAGKKLMYSVGSLLRTTSIGGDSAALIGDGRFSLVHAAATDMSVVTQRIEEMTKAADPAGRGAGAVMATVTMDGAEISEEALANGLLYTLKKFKEDGGLSISSLSANMAMLVHEATEHVGDFRLMLTQSAFHVVLQPIVHIHTGDVHHYEALCRFDKNAGESPFETIAFAEESGLIHDFDLAMASKVIDWLNKYPRNTNKYQVAVNVSGFSVGKPSYVSALIALLNRHSWTRGKLMFEITESARMSDLESANKFIQVIRKLGYPVCLDDFGAGAASFQYLSVLEVDVVKIDGSALKNAMRATKGAPFLTALTELCRRMGISTIAEMVETPEGLAFCRACGCDYVQGYLFGRPSADVRAFSPLPQINLFSRR